MLRYRRVRRGADVAHFQWLGVQWLDAPCCRPARSCSPRTTYCRGSLAPARPPRSAGSTTSRRAGRPLRVRSPAADRGARPASRAVHVIHHGAFEHLSANADELPLPDELRRVEGPVVLFFGLLRPYKGVDDAARRLAGDHRRGTVDRRPRADAGRAVPCARPGERPVRPALHLRRRAAGVLPPRRRCRAAVHADGAI